jgi:leucyl/phenylalanyl-tRNA--protein transferase
MSFDSPSRFPIETLLTGKTGDVIAGSDRIWPELLVDAYEHGIFPWPSGENETIPWCSPKKRALLFFAELTIPTSLKKAQKKFVGSGAWTFTRDQAFDEVIGACASQPRPGQAGTWITSQMLAAYSALHRMGRAHSVEVRDVDKKLIGGIYGVDCGGAFSAESMFFREPNASKLALLHLIELLKLKGSEWLDIQQLTPHLEKLGAREIKRVEYLQLLSTSQKKMGGLIF